MTKRSIKISAAFAGVLLVGSAVAGCSGGSGGDTPSGKSTTSGGSATSAASANTPYCKDMKSAIKDFGTLNAGDFSKLDAAFATFHTLAAESPSKIKADWAYLSSAMTTMEKGFKDAGIKFSDFAGLKTGTAPKGVSAAKLKKLSASMSEFGGAKFKTASDNIAKNAKDECKVDIAG